MHNNLFFRLKKISLLWLKHNKYCLFATIVTRPSTWRPHVQTVRLLCKSRWSLLSILIFVSSILPLTGLCAILGSIISLIYNTRSDTIPVCLINVWLLIECWVTHVPIPTYIAIYCLEGIFHTRCRDVVVRTYRLLGPLGGVMVSLVTLSAVDRGFNLWLDQRWSV